jgi:hypothetical protein
VVETSNWSGCGLVVPRPLLKRAKERPDMDRAGVYMLMGPPEEAGLLRVYIGEGDPIRPRLDQHAREKDFWTRAVLFTKKDQSLNKAHVQYLEARLVALASAARRCQLINGNVPTRPSMSEFEEADAEGFLAEMLLCLPPLGLDVFSMPTPAAAPEAALVLSGRGIKATGADTPAGFVVKAGSTAAKEPTESCQPWILTLRKSLVDTGVLRDEGDHLLMTQDYAFDSPSAASAAMLGRSSNGPVEWKDAAGISLKTLREKA